MTAKIHIPNQHPTVCPQWCTKWPYLKSCWVAEQSRDVHDQVRVTEMRDPCPSEKKRETSICRGQHLEVSEAREDNCVFKGFRLNSLFVFQSYCAPPHVWLNEEGRMRVMIVRWEVRRERERDEPKCDAAECCNRTGFSRRGNTGKCRLTRCLAHAHKLTHVCRKNEWGGKQRVAS